MSLKGVIAWAALIWATAAYATQPELLSIPIVPASLVLDDMPSYAQRNPEFSKGGVTFCGPAAASNALMWLADHGYPNLRPASADPSRTQVDMIKRLADYMGTYRQGTSVTGFTCGIRSYLKSAGYASGVWVHSGNSCANRTLTPPDLSLVNGLFKGKTVMWLSVGWYGLDDRMTYSRGNGHWVTLVGYGKNEQGQDDPYSLVIADPECPNCKRYITLLPLSDGRISDGRIRADAKGYYEVAEMNLTRKDGAIQHCILETIEMLTVQ